MKRTIVYVDGFNLYYRALKPWNARWLDLEAFFHASLPQGHRLIQVKYFTAEVDPFLDSNAPVRQRIYLAAIRNHCNLVHTIKGQFAVYPISAYAIRPFGERFKRFFTKKNRPISDVNFHLNDRFPMQEGELGEKVHVWRPEEKGSDVNLAAHLVHDAWSKAADSFVICSVDSDLCGALKIVRDEVGVDVGLLVPEGSGTKALSQSVTWKATLKAEVAGRCQLPNQITSSTGSNIIKPASW